MINLNKDIKFGLELECCYNSDLLPLQDMGWRDTRNFGTQIAKWNVTRDGSLRTTGTNYKNPGLTELVSKPFLYKDLYSILDKVKNYCLSKKKGAELFEFMEFNQSCGAHIHFSTPKGAERKMISTSACIKLRETVLERVRNEVPKVYPSFKKQYFREYAKKCESGLLLKRARTNEERRIEFNFTDLSKGAEWRSFNFSGVTTWDELYLMYDIACEEIAKTLTKFEESDCRESFTNLISEKEIQKYADLIKIGVTGGK